MKTILAKGVPWSADVSGKRWLAATVDALAWALAAAVLYAAVFYLSMWVL